MSLIQHLLNIKDLTVLIPIKLHLMLLVLNTLNHTGFFFYYPDVLKRGQVMFCRVFLTRCDMSSINRWLRYSSRGIFSDSDNKVNLIEKPGFVSEEHFSSHFPTWSHAVHLIMYAMIYVCLAGQILQLDTNLWLVFRQREYRWDMTSGRAFWISWYTSKWHTPWNGRNTWPLV